MSGLKELGNCWLKERRFRIASPWLNTTLILSSRCQPNSLTNDLILKVGPRTYSVFLCFVGRISRPCGVRFLFNGNGISIDRCITNWCSEFSHAYISVSSPNLFTCFCWISRLVSSTRQPLATWRIPCSIPYANLLKEFYLHSVSLCQRFSVQSLRSDCHWSTS